MDKVKKVSEIVVNVQIERETLKEYVYCSAHYIIDGDPGNAGILIQSYTIPDGLTHEDALYYSKQLFVEGLKKKGYVINE